MTVDQHELYVRSRQADAPLGGALRRFVRELAPQDVVVFVYLIGLNLAVLTAAASPLRTAASMNVGGLLILQVATVVAVRMRWLTHRLVAPLVYRLVTY